MMDLRELYQEIIIDHNRNPRNCHKMDSPTSEAKGFNPLCGDKVTVYVRFEQDRVVDISFEGQGCAISQASASLMTEVLKGKTTTDANTLFEQVHAMLTSDTAPVAPDKLAVLAGVREYPARVKCATLAWHTFEAAIKRAHAIVTTE